MNEKVSFLANELFITLHNRTPFNDELKYFDCLTKQSNYTAHNSATSFAVRSKLCQDNPNAKKFDEIYQQLHLANVKELEPYIMLLDSIKKNSNIMELLKNNADLNETEQLNSLYRKENLYTKEIKNRGTSSVSIKNKYQTLDFIDLSDIPGCPKEFPFINLLDQRAQENALIKDLLNCLMGCTGLYIRPIIPLDGIDRQFSIDSTMYHGFLDTVKSILVVASHVSLIARFIDVYSEYEYGSVNQALAEAINRHLRDFRVLVCQMENMHRHDNLNLVQMLNYLREPNGMMGLMASICSNIQKAQCKGGAILSLFHVSDGSAKHRELLKGLMHNTCFPFFRTLSWWIYRGVIEDSFEEFFIRENPKYQIPKSMIPSEIIVNPNFWTHSYKIESHLVPRFLEMHVDKILNTGKYLNVIQLCGFDARFPMIEEMVYETEDNYYITQIDRAYDYASKLLLDIMFNKMKLKDHFRFMKTYFLLCEADWLTLFMEMASDELNDKVDDCQLDRLESLLDVAVQGKNYPNDLLKDNLKIELSNQELIPFIYHVVSFKPGDKKRISNEMIGKNMRVLEAFTLNVVTEWPISLVFHTAIKQRYQILFRHVFYCHHVYRVLSSVWLMNKSSRHNYAYSTYLINKANALGGRMRTFMMNLIYYMTTEVIEPFWNIFMTKLDQAQNIDEVLQFHDTFIQSCLSNCMLSAPATLKGLQKMMVLCVTYTNRLTRLIGSNEITTLDPNQLLESKPFEDLVDQEDTKFNDIIKTLIYDINKCESDNKTLRNFVERMQYNDNFIKLV